MGSDGSCPRCHRLLATAPAARNLSAKDLDLKKLAAGDAADDLSAPWHFKLLVVGLVVYLGWRIVDLFV
ncbi:MAG: hypothetical protein ACKO84_08095 [Actinomycetota bacterium]